MVAQPKVPLATNVVAKTIGPRPEHAQEETTQTVNRMMTRKNASLTDADVAMMAATNELYVNLFNVDRRKEHIMQNINLYILVNC